MLRAFLKWFDHNQRPAALFTLVSLVFLLGLYAHEIFIALEALPLPTSDRAVGWWDYWLFRYQTLIAGILAIFGAAFAVYAAKLSIWYDKKKLQQASDENWRKSLAAVRAALVYAQNVIISKRELVRHSTSFPEDVYPAALLEITILEQVTTSNLSQMPLNLSMRCLHIAFSMHFTNNILNTHIGRKLVASRRDELRQATLDQFQRILLCADIVSFHLQFLAKAPLQDWKEEDFDIITWDLLGPLAAKWDVPRDHAEVLMKEMKISIVNPGSL